MVADYWAPCESHIETILMYSLFVKALKTALLRQPLSFLSMVPISESATAVKRVEWNSDTCSFHRHVAPSALFFSFSTSAQS